MIELTFRNINDLNFQKALGKLSSCPGLPPKEAYNVGKIWERVAQETKEARTLYSKIVDKYAKKDEAGKMVTKDTAPFFEFKEGTDSTKFNEEYEEFLDVKFAIERTKVRLGSIDKAGLTPVEITAIEVILEEV